MTTIGTRNTLAHTLIIRCEYVDQFGNVTDTDQRIARTLNTLCGSLSFLCNSHPLQADRIERLFSRVAIETLLEYPWGSRIKVQTDTDEWLIIAITRVDQSFRFMTTDIEADAAADTDFR